MIGNEMTFLSKLSNCISFLMQSENRLIKTMRFVVKVVFVLVCSFIGGHVISMMRNPYLIASTKDLVVKFKEVGFLKWIFAALHKYFLYGLIGILIFALLLWSIYKIHVKGGQERSQKTTSSKSAPMFIIISLLVFYFFSLSGFLRAKQRYINFYVSFQEGSLEEEQSLFQNMFPGFKKFHFLSHGEEAIRLLSHFTQKIHHPQSTQTLQTIAQLVKEQDKALSTFRSYLMNFRLLHSLSFTFYYLLMAAFIICTFLLFLCFFFCFKRQLVCTSEYRSLDQNESGDHEESPLTIISGTPSQKHSVCFFISYITIFILFASICFIFFIMGEISMELRAGKRFDSNLEQVQLCSFHPRSGGLSINIDFQTQLKITKKIEQFNIMATESLKAEPQMMNELQTHLDLYTNLCEVLTPYFTENKKIQMSLPYIFYSHFVIFLFLLWELSRIPNCLQRE